MTDLLHSYRKATRDLTPEVKARFHEYLIGALFNYIPDAKWRSSLETAKLCVKSLNPIPAATSDEQADKGGSDSPTSPHGADGSEDKS